jgi:hypothetical protein
MQIARFFYSVIRLNISVSNFDKVYKDSYFYYHHKPIPVHSLDARMFQLRDGLDPQLSEAAQKHILYDIQAINDLENIKRVHDYVMVGPVLEENAKPTCPIYIIVQVYTTNLTDALKEKLYNFVTKNLSSTKSRKRYLTGTSHPLYYQMTIRNIDLTDYTSAYHPFTNTWLKRPRFLGK